MKHAKAAGLAAALASCTPLPDYRCAREGMVKVERCAKESSLHISNDATGNCAASMTGSEYCHRCERYVTVEEHGCVEWVKK